MPSLNIADMMSRTRTMADKPKKKKNWIKGAIKHPGVEKERAKEHGVSTHEQLEEDSHSSNPTLRARGNLGLRFEGGGDLHKKKKKKSPLYDNPRSHAHG